MAADVTIPNNFVAGTPSVADDVDANFNALASWINSNAVHLDGSKAFTNVPSGPATDPTSANQLTRKAYVDSRYTICTSGTRPSSPVHGSVIYETDTQREWRWTGSAWRLLGGNPPRVGATTSGATSAAHNTLVTLNWNTEAYDTDNFHSTTTDTSRLTVPAGLGGLYMASYAISFAGGAGGGDRQAFMVVNGVSGRYAQSQVNAHAAGYGFQANGHAAILLNAGDYIQVLVFQNSGSNLNVGTTSDYFTLTWIGPT